MRLDLGRILAAVVISCALVAQPVSGAGRKRRPVAKKVVPKMSDTEWLATALIINRYSEGDGFKGCTPERFSHLASALDANSNILHSEKGEFETTQEFESRLSGVHKTLQEDSIVICEPLDDNSDVPFVFNADRGVFSGSFRTEHLIYRDSKNLGSYRSSTAMGVKATVKASVEVEYNVNLDRGSMGRTPCLQETGSKTEFEFPYDRSLAPTLKFNGSIAYVARLKIPYVSHTRTEGKPTIDYPYDDFVHSIDVYSKLERVVILDAANTVVWACDVNS